MGLVDWAVRLLIWALSSVQFCRTPRGLQLLEQGFQEQIWTSTLEPLWHPTVATATTRLAPPTTTRTMVPPTTTTNTTSEVYHRHPPMRHREGAFSCPDIQVLGRRPLLYPRRTSAWGARGPCRTHLPARVLWVARRSCQPWGLVGIHLLVTTLVLVEAVLVRGLWQEPTAPVSHPLCLATTIISKATEADLQTRQQLVFTSARPFYPPHCSTPNCTAQQAATKITSSIISITTIIITLPQQVHKTLWTIQTLLRASGNVLQCNKLANFYWEVAEARRVPVWRQWLRQEVR